ncbi:hypothetical protein CPB83DRAFT_909925 [Crepidotus variabilis]|uniref:Uncharacterized protein n=1 Tax=Crepidotus variabilis TaxID=179855 RepID=A0A9P6E899_9AGAR|nr:hypothetical protein CPB83DRAFT_909925 [Crepidotus variabilis]
MPPAAQSNTTGTFKSFFNSRFRGTVNFNDTNYILMGTLDSSLPPFECTSVEFKSIKRSTFVGTRAIEGRIGPETLDLTLDDGTKIQGKFKEKMGKNQEVVCGSIAFTPF